MAGQDCMELVWENGQLLMRVLSNGSSCISHSSQPPKAQVNDDRNITTKRSKLKSTVDSIFGDFPGDRQLTKHDMLDDLHGFYETKFNMSFENTKNNTYVKHITEPHVVPVYKPANSRSRNPSKLSAQIPELTTPRNDQPQLLSSLKQHQASAPLSRSTVNASQTLLEGLPNSKLKDLDSGPDKHLGLQNFSHFLRPPAPLKANGKSNGATRPSSSQSSSRLDRFKANNEKLPASSRNPVELTESQRNQTDLEATKMEPIRPIARPQKEAPPDEESEAIVHKDAFTSKRCVDQVVGPNSNKIKAKPDAGKSIDQLAPDTSICSRGASNYPTYSLKRRYEEDTEGMSSYPSKLKNLNKEQVGVATEAMPARGNAGSKRRRTAKQVHKLSERRRRDKINEKMRALQDLIPNSSKVDKASVLDEAIEYLKTLKRQVQIMSIGTGICMPPMMLPTGMHAPQNLAHFFPMGVGMGMRMHMGLGFSPGPFSTSAMLGVPVPGQILQPMSMSQPPFLPSMGGQSTHPVPVPGIPGVPIPMEFMGCASLLSPKDVAQNINSGVMNIGNTVGSKAQPSSQALEGTPIHQTSQKQ